MRPINSHISDCKITIDVWRRHSGAEGARTSGSITEGFDLFSSFWTRIIRLKDLTRITAVYSLIQITVLDRVQQVSTMRRSTGWIGWTLCLCASLTVSAQDLLQDDDMFLDLNQEDGTKPETRTGPAADFFRCSKAAWCVPGQYLVILHPGSHKSQVQRTVIRLKAKAARRGFLLEILEMYSGALKGFLVKMSSDVLHMARRLPHVHYIEEDSSIFAQSAPWNLQRLLQSYVGASENGTYKPPNDGRGTVVFLMDGSVQTSHREVDGRVLVTDFSSIPDEDGVRVHRQASQCDSHGTHMAGVISGADSGVARGAGVNLVRVLNCQGKGTVSGVLKGLEYILASLQVRPLDAVVVLLPFVGGFSRSLNAACQDMVANRVLVIAAAGNYRDDACLYSPASEPEVITVGAVNSADQLMLQGAGGTNFGRCVDLFAPGDDIVSASSDCSSCFTSRSGTSQAAAHTAGIAAVILSANQKASPVQVLQMMLHYSISNTINLLTLSDSHGLSTPNLVAAMPPSNDTDERLLCRWVWSERSGVTGSDQVVSRCRRGEEMMSCSSFSPDGVHAGETIRVSSRQAECVAHSGLQGEGVFAVARCCVISGLKCNVHVSPEPGRDAECLEPQQHLTGCSSRSSATVWSASRPHHGDRRRCLGEHGVTSHAVCCQAPSLECHLLEKSWADEEEVDVSCPSGWTLTDCRSISPGSAVLELGPNSNSCRVRGGGGGKEAGGERETSAAGAAGVAVCCRVRQAKQGADVRH